MLLRGGRTLIHAGSGSLAACGLSRNDKLLSRHKVAGSANAIGGRDCLDGGAGLARDRPEGVAGGYRVGCGLCCWGQQSKGCRGGKDGTRGANGAGVLGQG